MASQFPALIEGQPLSPDQREAALTWLRENYNHDASATDALCRFQQECQRKNGFRMSFAEGMAFVADLPEFKPKAATQRDHTTEEELGGAIPELLPFSKLPGYLLDRWGVPHRQVGQGRKPGKVLPDNRFFTKKGRGKPQHMWRYRLTIDGARRDFYPRYLAMARLLAEKEWRKEKLEGTKSQPEEVGLQHRESVPTNLGEVAP